MIWNGDVDALNKGLVFTDIADKLVVGTFLGVSR